MSVSRAVRTKWAATGVPVNVVTDLESEVAVSVSQLVSSL